MRSALCDDQRTTDSVRAVQRSGGRVRAEREGEGSLVTTHAMCGDTRDNMGASCGPQSPSGPLRVSEENKNNLWLSLKYLETFMKRMNQVLCVE